MTYHLVVVLLGVSYGVLVTAIGETSIELGACPPRPNTVANFDFQRVSDQVGICEDSYRLKNKFLLRIFP